MLDYVDALEFPKGKDEDFYHDMKMTLARIGEGLFWIYRNVEKMERIVRLEAEKTNMLIDIFNGPLSSIPTSWLSCAFQWYAVSVYNYARLVAWISGCAQINIYIKKVIPTVSNFRHKVAAHFAITAPRKEDNLSDLYSSIMTSVVYAHGHLRAGSLSESLVDSDGNEIVQSYKTSWSLTKVHKQLIPRYWPEGPMKANQAIRLSADSTRKFVVNCED